MPLRLKFPHLLYLALEKDCSVGVMEGRGWGIDGGAWEWRRRLFAWEEEYVRVWRILRNRILTKDNLVRRGVLSSTDMSCALGCDCTESVTHIFLQCTLSADLWPLVWKLLGISFV